MHTSRLFPSMAAVIGTTVLLGSTVSAQMTHYTDVQSGTWYEESAAALLRSGALDASETRLRPNDLATRAEVLKLLVSVYGETLVYPAESSFSDVPRSTWYFPYVETAANAGWLKGDKNCYGQGLTVCTARPAGHVNRAEMSALLQRAFNLPHLRLAPVFSDNNVNAAWYFVPIQTAADHCILQGDDYTGLVRPAANMNRAEMIVMFDRAAQQQRYGQDCAQQTANIQEIDAVSSTRVEVAFNVDLKPSHMGNASLYTIEAVGGNDIEITSVRVINARTIELQLASSAQNNTTYRVSVNNMLTENDDYFNASRTFIFTGSELEAEIESVMARSNTTLRVRFNEHVNANDADDAYRYAVRRVSDNTAVTVDNATVIDSMTVELQLRSALAGNTNYRTTASDIRTTSGITFSDTVTFNTGGFNTATVDEVTVRSNTLLRVRFSEDMDREELDDSFRYTLERLSGGGDINVNQAIIVSDDIVDLSLESSLSSNTSYVLRVENMQTGGGDNFSDSIIFSSTASEIEDITSMTSTRIRIDFNSTLEETRAEDETRYTVTGFDGDLQVGLASLIDSDSVEIVLNESMRNGEEYTLAVSSLRTAGGITFSDEEDFVYFTGQQNFEAMLNGTNEVPVVATLATGTGSFALTTSGLTYTITLSGIDNSDITGAHFHRGDVGVNGPVLEPISFSGLQASGTWSDLTPEERDDILDGDIYVNVHTSAYPDGEIRGQIVVQP